MTPMFPGNPTMASGVEATLIVRLRLADEYHRIFPMRSLHE